MKLEGRDAVTEYAMAWLRAFPDAHITIHNELVAGDWVAQEFAFDQVQVMAQLGLMPEPRRPSSFRLG